MAPAIGTGPWLYQNMVEGQSFSAKRNPDWFLKGRPYADGFEFVKVAEVTAILNAFRTARKRYGSIIAASQGIEDFVGTAESPHTIGLAILQNTETKFICAQVGELSRLRDVLHLSEPAVEAVKELRNVPGRFGARRQSA